MWPAIEADFHREYGIDMSEPGVLRSKTWRWFVVRIANLSGEAVVRQLVRNRKNTDPGAAMSALAAAANR